MPDSTWSTLFTIVVTIIIIKLVIILRNAFYNLRTLRRLLALLSVNTFRTPCELNALYKEIYPSGGDDGYDALAIYSYLPRLEKRKIVIGRESNQRCYCDREYCLSYNYQHGKPPKKKVRVEVPDGKYA